MRLLIAALVVLTLPAAPVAAQEKSFSEEQVKAFLARHCLDCHGPEKTKGDLRLDRLALDFADAKGRDRWHAVQEQLESGAMPPKAKARPPENEIKALLRWIDSKAAGAETVRRAAQGRVV